MKVAVLNPRGRDPRQEFPDFAGPVDDGVHAPVNYHAYAACTGGGFYRDTSEIPGDIRHVLVLLRRDLRPALKAVQAVAASGRLAAVSFKESGTHQVAPVLADARNVALFREICATAGRAIASTPELISLYRAAGAENSAFIPTPYPVDDPRWNFTVPEAQRDGIFIGTREFDVPSRNHAAALFAARELEVPVTVMNLDGRAGRRLVESIGISPDKLEIVEGRLPYSRYLQVIARHRLVFQLDRSAVPGQVAGDALLCRVPCVGGDGAIDRLTGDKHDPMETAARLLSDELSRQDVIQRAQDAALAACSFEAVARQLASFFTR